MFERFTTEVRESLQRATQLASDRGDSAIGPNHLLAGLADPSAGLSHGLLAKAGIDAQAVIRAMPAPAGTRGAVRPPFTASAKKALELSLREALGLGSGHIGPGHLLLGLLRLGPDGPAILTQGGITLEAARAEVGERSGGPRPGGRRSRRAGRFFDALAQHERAGSARSPSAEEIALRLATEEGSRLHRALAALGVTPEELQAAVADLGAEPGDAGPVELDLGDGTTLAVAAGPRAAELRALVAASAHVTSAEGSDGTLRAEVPALAGSVWATLEGWLAPDAA